jgi:hypothetical protein
MPNAELVGEYLTKIDEMINRQICLIKQLEAEGTDPTEAEHLLACWSAAYSFFAKRLAVAQGCVN